MNRPSSEMYASLPLYGGGKSVFRWSHFVQVGVARLSGLVRNDLQHDERVLFNFCRGVLKHGLDRVAARTARGRVACYPSRL